MFLLGWVSAALWPWSEPVLPRTMAFAWQNIWAVFWLEPAGQWSVVWRRGSMRRLTAVVWRLMACPALVWEHRWIVCIRGITRHCRRRALATVCY